MIPAGYLFKRVEARPDWLGVPGRPQRIFSMCGHISPDFADYVDFWRHNGFWLFDSPDIIEAVAADHGIELTGLTCFYYEEHEQQFDTEADRWLPVVPEKSFLTSVERPSAATLEGFDIVTFSGGTAPECSPLSCNSIAEEVAVNDRCLFDTFDEARRALESGLFRNAEPGPCRIVAVHTVGPRAVKAIVTRSI
ncbi:MAG: hypothetical protein JSS20_02290 [Proteobacteria bacterium]|nr:hypothetical protein [Pseudomonadota bacterium]